MILDNNTSLKYIILLSTSTHGVARRGTVSRQTPARLISSVRAILIYCWPTVQHMLNVVHLPCSYQHQRPVTHEALTQSWLDIGPALQTVGQH